MAETTEFIGGMEKIIAFIKSQSEKVKNLEEELCATNTALEIVKDENEVNKKNMMTLMKKNKKLKEKITCLESDSHNEVSQAEYDDMKEQLEEKLRMSRLYEFFRVCEGENGFHKNTNLYEKEWLSEMYDMINDRRESNMPEIDELFDEYKEWISYDEKENCSCDKCDEHCGPNDGIYIFERGIGDKHEDTHFCQACGDELHEQMRSEGWRRDDDEDDEEEQK